MDRRGFLKKTGVFATLLVSGCSKFTRQGSVSDLLSLEADVSENGKFTFVIAADPQPFWGAIENWKQTVTEINKVAPDFVIVCGDMTNVSGDEKEIKAYWEIANQLSPGIKLYHVAGNHDLHPDMKKEDVQLYKKNYGQLYYSFEHKNNLFIVFESTSLKSPSKETEQWRQEQFKWLKQTLVDSDKKDYANKFVFLHHPLILEKESEKEMYFNLPVPVRNKLLKLFRTHGVRIAFSGHLHQDRVVKLDDIELVTTGSCGKALGESDLGFRIVNVDGDKVEHNYVVLPDQSLRY